MEIRLTEEQAAFVRMGIATGRYHGEADALAEALALWEERERRRIQILAAVDLAEAVAQQGEVRDVRTREESLRLASDIKKRGRARLATERDPL